MVPEGVCLFKFCTLRDHLFHPSPALPLTPAWPAHAPPDPHHGQLRHQDKVLRRRQLHPVGEPQVVQQNLHLLGLGVLLQQAAGANAEGHMGHLGALLGWSPWPGPVQGHLASIGMAGPPSSTQTSSRLALQGYPGTPLQTRLQSVLSLTWALLTPGWVTMAQPHRS